MLGFVVLILQWIRSWLPNFSRSTLPLSMRRPGMSSEAPIKRGTVVKIEGLLNNPEDNGKIGLCLDFKPEKERFAVKLISGGQQILVREVNLSLYDPVYEAVYCSDIGSITMCYELMDALVKHFNWSYEWDIHPLSQFSKESTGTRSILNCKAYGASHEFNLDVVKCRDGAVFGRIFQAYANEYSAKQWLLEHQVWMSAKQIKKFFTDLGCLQRMIDAFVKNDLIESLMIPPGKSPVEFSRAEAERALASSAQYGQGPFNLGTQPGKWDDKSIKEYINAHQYDCPDGVCRGGMTMTHRDYPGSGDIFLVFRVKQWSKIMQFSHKLFYGAGPIFPLVALKNQGHQWSYKRVRVNTSDESFQLA